jgi:Putative zinc-finger
MTFETGGLHHVGHVHSALSEYLDGGLSETESREVAAHLATCSRCQADLATLRLSVGAVRSLPLRPAPRSFALTVTRSRTPALITWLRVSSGALAAVFVAVLAAQLVLNNGTPPASAPTLQRSVASQGATSAVDRATSSPTARPPVSNSAPLAAAPAVPQAAAPAAPQPAAPAAAPQSAAPAAAPSLAPLPPATPAPVSQSPAVPGTAPQLAAAPAAAPAAPRPAPAGPGSTALANQPAAKAAGGGQAQVAGATPTLEAYPAATTPVAAPSAPSVVSYPGGYPVPSESAPTETALPGGAPSGSVITLGGRGSWFTPALAILGLLTIVSIGVMLLLSRRH